GESNNRGSQDWQQRMGGNNQQWGQEDSYNQGNRGSFDRGGSSFDERGYQQGRFQASGRYNDRGYAGDESNMQYGDRGYGGGGGGSGQFQSGQHQQGGGYGGNFNSMYDRDYTQSQGQSQGQNYGQSQGQMYGQSQGGRRQFQGKGPKGYTRSDERIREEIC